MTGEGQHYHVIDTDLAQCHSIQCVCHRAATCGSIKPTSWTGSQIWFLLVQIYV